MTAQASPDFVLTPEQISHFMEHGYIHLKSCFTPEFADTVKEGLWDRLGMSPTDKKTWSQERINMPMHRTFDIATYAPAAWAAISQLVGGEDRVLSKQRVWNDSLIVNLGTPENEGKHMPPQALPGWHVDGDFFVHYLDSPEQALLVIPCFTKIVSGGGGTMIAPDAIPKVAKHLYEHPEGVSPRMTPRGENPNFVEEKGLDWFCSLAKTCNNFVEVTGDVGDVFLLHPLMLHSSSTNPLRMVRVITNPPVSIQDPFCFDRKDGNYSIVECATLKALGKDNLEGWAITGERQNLVPERVRIQEKMKRGEEERLEAMRSKLKTSPMVAANA
ncbi:hypothetical protein BDY21DRAFT_339699 [Lineolata rhizophorae]|uniref:Phytanoyl-CoA dioxygenase n=1 Tax=Lineolata rhizophorae TaxID=578093 RepID=A0A6A6P5K0_9PEZI|nr:hypothetical protein BDY21DRAFT_339699 [Lineolata rhizophorae]